MKRLYILFSSFIVLQLSATAQDFAFFYNGIKLDNNTEITVNEYIIENDGTEQEPDYYANFESNLELRNLTPMTINGGMIQEVLTRPQFGTLSFCFGNCVLTNDNYTLETSVAPTNTTALHLSYIVPKDMFETAKATYSVYNKLNPYEKVSVTVTYSYVNNTGLNTPLSADEFNVYQLGDMLNINYELKEIEPYSIHLYNLVGKEVFSQSLTTLSGNVKVSGLAKGIYITSLRKGNQVATTCKVIIK